MPCYTGFFRKNGAEALKRALLTLLAAAVLPILVGCGGGGSSSNNTTTAPTSKIKKRVLVTDQFTGQIYIVDATLDKFLGNTISTAQGPTIMAEFPDKLHTVVVTNGGSTLGVLDNTTEAFTIDFGLSAPTESIAVSSDNKTVYAAVRNTPFAGQLPGSIEIADITAAAATTTTIQVPQVRRIVLSHNGAKLLAFSDNSDKVGVIDTATKAVTYISGFDRPVNAVFSSDDSTAYILSCGAECGGTTAKVNALTMANSAVGPDVVVSGATVGLLDSGNLYVAGSNSGQGKLDIVSTSTMSVTKSGVAIANGYHTLMALAGGQLFIGSAGCSNTSNGCLSVYSSSGSQVVNSAAGTGDVTGIQPIDGRTVVYVIEGGELVIWDTTTVAPIDSSKQIDFVGHAYGVQLID
jgi:hypothetical protein